MCGIFGWITPGRPVDRARAVTGTNRMRHRGPDDEGYLLASLHSRRAMLAAGDETSPVLRLPRWDDPALPQEADVLFGFRRLAIHDLSEAGHQPMGTPDGKLWIVFNGEVYNFIELREELRRIGVVFRSGTDTEVILRAYEQWGPDCLRRFNGMWGLAILDLRGEKSEFFMARDRCGVKPLFFAEDGQGGVAFASELKAVLETRSRWTVDDVQAANFLAWARNPSPKAGDTMFKEVRMLPPGCSARLTDRGLRIERWWDLPETGDGTDCGPEDAVARLRELVEDAVRLRLRADVPVGSCLSGGLDSSVIVGMVNRLLQTDAGLTNTGGRQHTFSAVYDVEGPFNERVFIERVLSGISASAHYTIPSVTKMAEDFDRMVWHQDEPFTTTSIFAQWCVMRLVRESGVTVLLDGQAADELLAGYRPFRSHLTDIVRARGIAAAWRERNQILNGTGDQSAKKAFLLSLPSGLLPRSFVKVAARTGYGRALRRAAGSILANGQTAPLMDRTLDPEAPESYPWRRVPESTDEHLRGLVSDFVLPQLLRFEDRNSMAFSVEARVPFTDWRIVEFAFSPAMRALKIREGWPKWALRKAGAGLVPDDILWRKDKMGFGTPEPELVRGLAIHWLSSGRTVEGIARWADPVRAHALIARAAKGATRGAETLMAFRVLCLESWARQFAPGV